MKFGLIATVAVAAIAFGAETASAQVIIPHRNHYHVVPTTPIVPSYSPGLGFNSGFYAPPIIKYPSVYPTYFGNPVVVPHTTTHLHLVPHRGHFHAVPHTTTHFHVIRP
jgi:hypothetical protein